MSYRLLCPWNSPGKNTQWVAISFSRGYSWPRDLTWVSCIGRWILYHWYSFSSVTQLCLTLCDPMDCSTPGFPIHYQLPELQIHVHRVGDAIQPSHPLVSPSPPTLMLGKIESFTVSQFFTSCGQSIGVSASASVLPMNTQDWFPLGLTGWISLQSKAFSSQL